MDNAIENEINGIVDLILDDYKHERIIDQVQPFDQPDTEAVADILNKLLRIIFPGFFWDKSYRFYNMNSQLTVLIEDVMYNLNKQIGIALHQTPEYTGKTETQIAASAQAVCISFFKQIQKIREYVQTDVEAAFAGDPAAFNYNEIILCYPGLYAIAVSRVAHELFLLGVPLIPRMMTEQAHNKTGIDIHPGANIGKYFFIDHGTGIVVGETTVIGENVKVYQGVTIGALSTRGGQHLKGVKRHPTIEDNVTIYAGASILGGETVIGHDSVIGSNAFLTKSVAPGSRVSIKNQELNIKDTNGFDISENEWFYII